MTHNRPFRHKLLVSASLSAILLTGAAAQAQSEGGWSGGRGGTSDPAAAAARAAQDQALRQAQTSSATQRALDAFRRSAQTRTQMQDAQVQARIAAQQAINTVANGLKPGGLRQAPEIAIDPSLWQGANDPSQSAGKNGRTNVTVDQTQQKAILTWDSFNVGRETDLTFNQQSADWVVLNRVRDASPSQIHGTINAKGTVLILNQNGVLFGGASTVNVRNLVASSANITNDQFLKRGIYSENIGNSFFAKYVPAFSGAGGKITVEAGAQIRTHAPESATQGGGYVLLMGTEVTNAGSIATPKGQTLLSAGDDFLVRRGYGTAENQYSTTRGNEVRGLIANGSNSGTVTNKGLIEAAQGDITLGGRTIRQDGVLVATTGINQRGTIHLLNSASDTLGSVTLGKDSLTIILPELQAKDKGLDAQRSALIKESETANGQRQSTIAGLFDDRSLLADRLDQSRIEIVTGGDVLFQGGSQTSAQGGQVAVQATNGRITTETGARIDVSGVMGVALDMESNSIKVNVQGNELRDSPANRENDKLKSQDIWIDVRDLILVPGKKGVYDGDRYYTKGGLLEVGGWLGNTEHGIGEWAAIGGTITLAAKEVVAHKGAVFDLSGGSLDYQAGWVNSTRVLGEDGKLYDVGTAPAWMKMLAWGDAFVRKHDRWGEQYTQIWSHPLGGARNSRRWSEGYSVGRDGGSLILSAPTVIFDGDIVSEVITGERQHLARPNAVVLDGYTIAQNQVALGGGLILGNYSAAGRAGGFATDVKISGGTAPYAIGDDGKISDDRLNTAWFDGQRLSSFKLGRIDLLTSTQVKVEAGLTLGDGGHVSLAAPNVDVSARITAHSGSVTLSNIYRGLNGSETGADGVIKLSNGGVLDVSGKWTNAVLDPQALKDLGFVHGGSVTLRSTKDVLVEAGSLIDVSSGAALLADGTFSGGRGGNISLLADTRLSGGKAGSGKFQLDGTIKANGVLGGGTLTVEGGPAIVIGGKLLANDGELGAGEFAKVDLVTAEAYFVKAGETLPFDLSYLKTEAKPGEEIGGQFKLDRGDTPLTLGADWTPPLARNGVYTLVVDGVRVFVGPYVPIDPLRAGQKIERIIGASEFPTNYVIPGDVFPNGIPIRPAQVTLRAGSKSPVDSMFEPGLRVAAGTRLPRPVKVEALQSLRADLFGLGFSSYAIDGHRGVAVVDGAKIEATAPVYRLRAGSFEIPSGARAADALELWTPPVFIEDQVNGRLIQRAGADIALRADGQREGIGGSISIGRDASVVVDPGRTISLAAHGDAQVIVDGTLRTSGGTVSIDIGRREFDKGNPKANNRSIWIGEKAVIDVAGRAVTATDAQGHVYGSVLKGGTILIGGVLDWEETGKAQATDAFVVVRAGAVLDASGAQARIDVPSGGLRAAETVNVASNGGTIVLKSNNGLFLDGTIRAKAGGAGAAGGTLALALETPSYELSAGVDGALRKPRELILSQHRVGGGLDAALRPNEGNEALRYGAARLDVDTVAAGGFDNLSILVNGLISFDGTTSLAMGESLRLYSSAIALSENAPADSRVTLGSPYLRLAGSTRGALDFHIMPTVTAAHQSRSEQTDEAQLRINAKLIDIREYVGFGARATIAQAAGGPMIVDRRGFSAIDIASEGDLRFTKGKMPWTGINSRIDAPGSLTITAGQIYPDTGVSAQILAKTSLTIGKAAGTTPDIPWSVFGKLYLDAPIVRQGGVIRAPGGAIEIGRTGKETILLPGSITSVSMAGLVMPYGGTVDGLSYKFNGQDVGFTGIVTDNLTSFTANGIGLGGARIDVNEGAVLDLSGGGELLGAGFISGRGGSVDVLHNALADANPGFAFSASGNKVYAIVPTFRGSYAPTAADADNPAIGQQVVIPAGVPGLAAGTYTLLPATYAMLPGAFRVELGQPMLSGRSDVQSLGNGTYLAPGYEATANTQIRSSLAQALLVTPSKTVRTYSGYNEMNLADFGIARAKQLGWARPRIAADAGNLSLAFNLDDENPGNALRFDGKALLAGGKGGFAGQVSVRAREDGGKIEILPDGGRHQAGFVSVEASSLNAIGAPRLVIGGSLWQQNGDSDRGAYPSPIIRVESRGGDLVLRSGAILSAPEVILVSGYQQSRITVEAGSSINTIGKGKPAYDSSAGYLFDPRATSVVAVSNGWFEMLPPQSKVESLLSGGTINIGACPQADCATATTLYAENTIAFASQQRINIASTVRYGAKNLTLGVTAVNIGSDASLADAANRKALSPGLSFNQSVLQELLAGNSGAGIPKLESLTLSARESVNFFGTVELNTIDPVTGKSSLKQLVLNTPAIYGYGDANDVATLTTGNLIWTGISEGGYETSDPIFTRSLAPGVVLPGGAGTGHGKLNLIADRIDLGYGDRVRADNQVTLDRLILGFGNANLSAKQVISGNAKGTLAVYETQGAYVAGKGHSYSGGNLRLETPLLTGAAGSVLAITAGGGLNVVGPQGADLAKSSSDALGATLTLKAASIDVGTAVVLPSGKLTLSSNGDITLRDAARLDLSGRAIRMFDTTQYSWGGDISIESANGNVTQAAGSLIDISAQNNQAGHLTVVALGETAGRIDLAGAFRGTATGRYDAGAGVEIGYLSGRAEVRGQTIADFSGLNQRLNTGGVAGERTFQLKQGNLVIADEIKAGVVNLSVDGGSLTVNGRIDASGERVGVIRLAARDGLTIGSSAVLDAHGTVLRVDSDGKPIDAPNRAIVSLTSQRGTLALQSGATIDVRSADAISRGTVTLNASRRGGANGDGDGANDIAIDAANAVSIRGARTIAVNGFRTYKDAPLATETDTYGRYNQVVSRAYLDEIHAGSEEFINAALGNTGLRSRIAGLASYSDAFHLRPGVEITSDAPDRGIVIDGDLDLSRYRYESVSSKFARTEIYGSGEPGAIVIRAGDNLDIYGSINDGFMPIDTPDGNGWTLTNGTERYLSPVILPRAVTLKGGETGSATQLASGNVQSLNYDIPIRATKVRTGVALALDVTVATDITLPAGMVLRAGIVLPDGTALSAGSVLANETALPAGTRLAAGSVVPTSLGYGIDVEAMTVPAGTPLNMFSDQFLYLSRDLTLKAGAIIPHKSKVVSPTGMDIDLRPIADDGKQGKTFVVAPMLAAGSQSWDIGLVAGADIAAADARLLQTREQLSGRGTMTLADLHYMPDVTSGMYAAPMIPSVIRTGTGDLSLLAGGDFNQVSLYGIYTAGTQSSPIVDKDGRNPYNLPRGQWPADTDPITGLQSVLGPYFGSYSPDYEALVTGPNYQAWYPEQGGNLLVAAQGNMTGVIHDGGNPNRPSSTLSNLVGNWSWRQGGADQKAAWWINFGTYASPHYYTFYDFIPQVPAFTGFGALGGGNVAVRVGGNAGVQSSRGEFSYASSQGLNIAVGSTGRVLDDGTIVRTGGGDVLFTVDGAINPLHGVLNGSRSPQGLKNDLNGTVTNLRGSVDIRAGAMGRIDLSYGTVGENDPRAPDAFEATQGTAQGGMVLILGDAAARLAGRGDLVLGGIVDAGTGQQVNSTPYGVDGVDYAGGGNTAFPLWTSATALDLFSAGGNLTPFVRSTATSNALTSNDIGKDGLLPARMRIVAATGSLYLDGGGDMIPARTIQLDLLAGQSIFGNGAAFYPNGLDPADLASPLRPDFYAGWMIGDGERRFNPIGSLINTAATNLHGGELDPLRFFAVRGDVIGLTSGRFQPADSFYADRYVAAKPGHVRAGRDIVSFRGLFLNNNIDDISLVSAGRDILFANIDVAGPGTLEVSAGRNIYQADNGSITSRGAIFTGDTRPGANIFMSAGQDANGLNYAAIRKRYLDPANLADPKRPLSDPQNEGKAVKIYDKELASWLKERYGFTGSASEALTRFDALTPELQSLFLRQIYYAELREGGREYTDANNPRFGSYLRGRQMIATLLPEKDAAGKVIERTGDIIMFGGSGVRTNFGGNIEMLAPGGQIVIGVQGEVPPGTAGVMTQGKGDIRLYSQKSILLGLSRIMTTFGGSIVGWSAQGDINAGRGAKTTVLYTPPRRTYNNDGNVTLAPLAPSSGAGIATLNPIPEVARGDIDLIAPLGTIDAGEAGIRVSGSINLAALQVLNAANIKVQGEASGLPVVAAVNTGALTSASSAASAVANQAAQLAERARPQPRMDVPVILTVTFAGFGE